MRYCASDKVEIIQLVQNSDLSVRQTLARLDIHKSTFYNWLKRYVENGTDGLEDKKPIPQAVWNKIAEEHCEAIIELALDKPDLSPRELAVSYTDTQAYFVSESTVYRPLKEQDLITRSAYILMEASDKFQHPTTRVNEMWQTDFTYFKIIGWGWYYLSTVLDDYSRYIIAWVSVSYTDTQAYFVSESTVYRPLKEQDLITRSAYILMEASDKFQHPTTRVNEMWQTDFTYFKIIGWGWYYLSTVLDDYSRYIIAWRLCTGMSTRGVSDTLDDALSFTGLAEVKVNHKPRLLSDNGPCYISGELADYLEENGMTHTRGRPYHPQTQGKIERWHRSMKNQILLHNYYLPGELEEQLQRFVSYYNHERYHESLNNLTPADVFYGRGEEILNQRELVKQNTLAMRRRMHYDKQQVNHTPT